MEYAVTYLFVINIITFAAYGLDKHKAVKDKWRIPETALIVLAMLGGSIGALGGMLAFHHKTKKPKFVIGIPLILLVEVLAMILLLM